MISFGPTEEQELIRDTVREFAQSEMREIARECDEKYALPQDFLDKTWELGLVNGGIPEEHGGGGIGRSPVTNALILEELAWGDVPLATAAMAPGLFIQPLLDFGTEEQKEQFLPLFTTSKFHAASLALHEPSFTFDPTNLKTIALPKGDAFELNGTKRMVPLGDRASHFLVVANSGRAGVAGVDAFIVPRDAKGLSITTEAEKTLGFQAVPMSVLELSKVEVPAELRLGGERGMDGARLLNLLRVGTSALALGLSRAMLETAIPYAKERVAFDQPIAQKQAIAFMLAEMQIEVNSMRNLIWKAASQLEQGVDASRMSTLAQTYVRREAMKLVDNGLQVFGGHGFIRDYPVEMWYRNGRAVTVCDAIASL